MSRTIADTGKVARTAFREAAAVDKPRVDTHAGPREWGFHYVVKPLASLKLTVTLFALATFLVFAGTLAQVDKGIWHVMEQYFRTKYGIAWIEVPIFFPRAWNVPNIVFPFPGGYLLGGILLINLIAAHAVRFRITAEGHRLRTGWTVTGLGAVLTAALIGEMHFAVPALHVFYMELLLITLVVVVLGVGFWLLFARRYGIVMLHAGLIILLFSEAVTGWFAEEGQMSILIGGSSNYVQDIRTVELAVIEPGEGQTDDVVVIPRNILQESERQGETIHSELLPFDLQVAKLMINSSLHSAGEVPGTNPGNRGAAEMYVATQQPQVAGVKGEEVDVAAAYVTLKDKATGESMGTWLFSQELKPQMIPAGGKSYQVVLRFKRLYKPYTLHLTEFNHDVYPGTTTPKDFSSFVRLVDPDRGEDRDVRIWMNNPLRYAGETFYQSRVLQNVENGPAVGTVLQVVENPGRIIPYLSCIMVAGGLIAHFVVGLSRFTGRRLA
jgi:hypothetical protein